MDEHYEQDGPMYRIGHQVHDHEARIRILERDAIVLTEGFKTIKDAMRELQCEVSSKLDALHDQLDAHVTQENKDRSKLIATSVGQIIAIAIGIILIYFERAA